MEKASTDQTQYARSLIEAILDPLFTINPVGKITDMNNASANSIGISRDEIIGTDFFEYFTEPKKAREVYKEVFAKESVIDFPLTIQHKFGKLTSLLFNGSTYKDNKGRVLGVVMVAKDITAQEKMATVLLE